MARFVFAAQPQGIRSHFSDRKIGRYPSTDLRKSVLLGSLLVFLTLVFFTPAFATEGAKWWYEQARTFYQEGDHDRALALLEELEKRFPKERPLVAKARLLAAEIYFERNDYQKVLDLLRPLIKEADLPPRAYILLAASAEALGLYEDALTYVRFLKTKFPECPEICEGNLIAARIFLARKIPEKTKRLADMVFSSDKCKLEEKAKAISILLKAGESPEKFLAFLEKNPSAKTRAPQILKTLALYHLKQGNIKKAEEEIFEYLNLSGQIKETPSLLFKLGEAYFSRKDYRAARRIFELIYTSWPQEPEGTYAKFRLYQMRYLFEEKIGIKRPETRRFLLNLCRLLKKDYPNAPITEEAHAFEIKLLLEDKNIEACLKSVWDFLKKYPKSSYLSEVYPVLCRAASLWEQALLGEKRYQEIITFFAEHKNALTKASCAMSFYWAAQAYLKLGLDTKARLILLEGYFLPIPANWKADYLLSLCELLLKGDKEAKSLSGKILEKYAEKDETAGENPYYRYLLGLYKESQGALVSAIPDFEFAYQKTQDPELKKDILHKILYLYVQVGRYEKALNLLKKAQKVDALLGKTLALKTLSEEKYSLCAQVLSFLQKKFPDDRELLWIKGLLLERQGEAETALALWQKLSQEKDLYGRLSSTLVKAQELVDAARSEIY